MRNHQRIQGRGERKGIPHLFRHVPCSFPPGGGARPSSPQSPFLNPPTEGCQGWPRGGRNPSGRPGSPPPPGLVFPSGGGWARGWGARRVGVRGESAPAARSREVAETLVGLSCLRR